MGDHCDLNCAGCAQTGAPYVRSMLARVLAIRNEIDRAAFERRPHIELQIQAHQLLEIARHRQDRCPSRRTETRAPASVDA